MTDTSAGSAFPTATSILTAAIGFLAGGLSMAFNPLFATTIVAIALGVVTLRSASPVANPVAQGLLRIFAVLAIMGGLGGAVALAFPGLGVSTS